MNITMPVTPALSAALISVENYLRRIDPSNGVDHAKLDGVRIKDRTHYAEAVGKLEDLTRAMLDSMSSMPLVGPVLGTGARMTFSPDDSMNTGLFRAANYLRDTATKVLAGDQPDLDQYGSHMTRSVHEELRVLQGKAIGSITRAAREDLVTLRERGVNDFLNAAALLSKAVADEAAPFTPVATAATATRPRIERD